MPVRQRSGAFLVHAWEVLRTVPAGAPVTYTEYAAKSGRPAAVRAAASACARNAAALFVPCHRVLRTDGTLGGFRWGVECKRRLIAHEADPHPAHSGAVAQSSPSPRNRTSEPECCCVAPQTAVRSHSAVLGGLAATDPGNPITH